MSKRKEKGITLVALVITIIVLLILAGISVTSITGDNGLLNKATGAKSATEKRDEQERLQIILNNYVAMELTTSESLKQYLESKKGTNELTDIKENIDNSKITVTVNKYTFNVDTTTYNVIEE